MKALKFALISLLLVVSCTTKKEEKKETVVDKEVINKLLDNWHKNAATAKYEDYFKAVDSGFVFMGTDAHEHWSYEKFKEFSKPYFAKGAAWDFKPVLRNLYISNNGDVAWFDELLDTWMGVCRGSGVLQKVNNEWKIEQYVLSVTIPNHNITKVIEINKEKDSVFLKRLSGN